MDGEELLRALASGEMDKLASGIPEEHRDTVDKLKAASDNGDIGAIFDIASECLAKASEILSSDDLEETEET